MPPIDAVLLRYRLQLIDSPIEWIAIHGFEQFDGLVHGTYSITHNIIRQCCLGFSAANQPKILMSATPNTSAKPGQTIIATLRADAWSGITAEVHAYGSIVEARRRLGGYS
jgi:hypothetical protein